MSSAAGSDDDMIRLDGATLEGGGQIIRNAIALAVLARKPVHIFNIRAGRPKPGFARQHLTGVNLAVDMSEANAEGNREGSTTLSFWPQQLPTRARYMADVKTAGSATLILQLALPCALLSPESITLEIRGGTDVPFSPPAEFYRKVFVPMVAKFGVHMDTEVPRLGFMPRGGGTMIVKTTPATLPLPPLELLDRGELKELELVAVAGGSEGRRYAERVNVVVCKRLRRELPTSAPLQNATIVNPRAQPGLSVMLIARTTTDCVLASTALADNRRITPDELAGELVDGFLATLCTGACVDEHLQDQLLLFMALAGGTSKVLVGEITQHTRAAMWVAEQMVGARFEVLPPPESVRAPAVGGKLSVLACHGIGMTAAK